MKKAILSLLALPLLFACSSEENEINRHAGRVPLQMEFDGITRAAMEGSTLPDNSHIGVFVSTNYKYPDTYIVDNGNNASVLYASGKCQFNTPVYIPESQSVYVWAYYPYSSNYDASMLTKGWSLDVKSQSDYMVSSSYMTATESSPSVKMTLRHLMSRVHVTVCKSEGNTKLYYYKEAVLKGVYMTGSYSFMSGTVSLSDGIGEITTYISKGTSSLQDGPVEFDFLVLPSSKALTMSVALPGSPELEATLPSRTYVSGQQYNITLTINHLGQLVVGDWTIEPWASQKESSLEVWQDSKSGM